MQRLHSLYYKPNKNDERGVFSTEFIKRGSVIEICPVVIIPKNQVQVIHQTIIHDYYFLWDHDRAALALGYGSLYNHAYQPNAEYLMDFKSKEIIIKAIQDIEPGEEICFNYNGDPDDLGRLWFDVQ